MKAADIKVGGYYLAKVSNKLIMVRIDAIREGFDNRIRYDVTNLTTGRKTTFRSAAKFRMEINQGDRKVRTLTEGTRRSPRDRAKIECSDPTPAGARPQEKNGPTAISNDSRSQTRRSHPRSISSAETGTTSRISAAGAQPVKPQGSLVNLLKKSIQKERQKSRLNGMFTGIPSANDPPEANGLKGDQLKAFREQVYLLTAGEKLIKLCGFAGTGKTFLLARIAQWAKQQGYQVTIAAPTHKAAGVIQEKLVADIEVRTIHSLLGLKLEPDYENDTGGRVLQAADSKSKIKQGLVICDEASMVGSVLKEHINANKEISWLFVGDLAQLPPVGESISELLDDPDSTLEEVLRQAQGSEILNLATRIRQQDLSMCFEGGKDVFQVESAEELFQAALKRFNTEDFSVNALHARMLVFRNDRRKAINQRMRALLIKSEEPFVPGEWLVMYAAFSPEKSRLNVLAEEAKKTQKGSYEGKRAWKKFFNYKDSLGATVTQLHVSEEVQIEDVTEGTVKIAEWEFKVRKLNVRARGDKSYELPVLMEEEVERVEELKAGKASEARNAREERDKYEYGCDQWNLFDDQRKRAWSVFFTLEETFAQVDYCYAMTVHKSQGSTFDHAFVDVPDLMSSGGMQGRILYTAVTRPSKTLTFYC